MMLKKYGKHALALLLCAMMLFSLAACGGNDPVEDEPDVSSSSKPVSSSSEADSGKISEDVAKKIDEAKTINPETVSWLTIPNTNIDYPVLYSPDSNEKYIVNDINGKKTTLDASKMDKDVAAHLNGVKAYNGAICYDNRDVVPGGTEVSRNTILYGHNWTNIVEPFRIGNTKDYDVMFAQLMSYTDENFAKQNPYIYLSTGDTTKVYKVFSVVYFNVFCSNYITPNPDDEMYQKLLDDAQARTLYKYDTPVSIDDNIINLITCVRKYPKSVTQGDGFNIQRFTILARELRDGETDKDAVTVTKNTGNLDPKWTMKTHKL